MIKEAGTVNPFRVEPQENEEGYEGWLPVDDEPGVDNAVTIDEFHIVLKALLDEGKKKRKKKRKTKKKKGKKRAPQGLAWYYGGGYDLGSCDAGDSIGIGDGGGE